MYLSVFDLLVTSFKWWQYELSDNLTQLILNIWDNVMKLSLLKNAYTLFKIIPNHIPIISPIESLEIPYKFNK